jgi:hypothetical protein
MSRRKKKQGKAKEKNKLRIRNLWPRMTEAERKEVCDRAVPDFMRAANFHKRVWSDIPQQWQSPIGKRANIPRAVALQIADR